MDKDYETTFYNCYRNCESTNDECERSTEKNPKNCAVKNSVCVKQCDHIRGWDGRFWS
jgi:hypothetical protein